MRWSRASVLGLLLISGYVSASEGEPLLLREWHVASPFPNLPFQESSDHVEVARRFIRPTERYHVVFPGPIRDIEGQILEPSMWGFLEDRSWEVGWEARRQESSVFDLLDYTPIRNHVISYLMTYLQVDDPCHVWFHAGSHDEIDLFVDGTQVLKMEKRIPEEWSVGHARVFLERGDHSLLVKVHGLEGRHDVQVRLSPDEGHKAMPVRHGWTPLVGEFWSRCVGLHGVDAMGGNLVVFLDEPNKEVSERATALHLQAAASFPCSVRLKWSILAPNGESIVDQSGELGLNPNRAENVSLPVRLTQAGRHGLKLEAVRSEGVAATDALGVVELSFLVLDDVSFRNRFREMEASLEKMRFECARRDRMIGVLEADRQRLRWLTEEPEEREGSLPSPGQIPEQDRESFQPAAQARMRLALTQGWEMVWSEDPEPPTQGWILPPHPIVGWFGEAEKPLWLRVPIHLPKETDEPGVQLILEGAGHAVQVWCNGQKVQEGFGEFVPLISDLSSSWIHAGENTICLRLESAASLAGPDAYLGLWERAFLSPNHVGLLREPVLMFHPLVWVRDVRVMGENEPGEIEVLIQVLNHQEEPASRLLDVKLLEGGQVLSKLPWRELELEPGGVLDSLYSIPWPRERLWFGMGCRLGNPRLFSLAVSLRTDPMGPAQDQDVYGLGISNMDARGTRLFSHGEEVRLRSVRLPSSCLGLGPKEWVELLQTLLAKGANGFMLQGVAEQPMILADEMGMHVQPHISPSGRFMVRDDLLWEGYKEQVRNWITRWTNHPSVALWSVSEGLTGLREQDTELDMRLLELDALLRDMGDRRLMVHRGCPSSWWNEGFALAHVSDGKEYPLFLFGWEGRFRRPVFVDENYPWPMEGRDVEDLRRRLEAYELRHIPSVTLVLPELPTERLFEALHSLPTETIWSVESAVPPCPNRSLISLRVSHAGLAVPGLLAGVLPGSACPGRSMSGFTDDKGEIRFLMEQGEWTAYCVVAGTRVERSIPVEAGDGWSSPGRILELEIP